MRGMSRDLLSLFPASPEDVPAKFRRTADDTGLMLLVGGTLSRAATGKPIRSAVCFRAGDAPPVQVELGPGALATGDDSRAALASAVAAWWGGRGDWPRASTRERVAAVRDFAARALPLRETIATALMWEVGKPYAECLTEFDRTFEYVEKTCAALVALESQSARPETSGGFTARIRRAPLGVTLCLGPYNYALNEVFTLVIPALIMGNPVIIKTPRYGVLANALLAPALAASFPTGVASLLTGDGATIVGPLMESGAIDVLAFIGSQKTAGALLRQHPHPYRLRTVLGMGAKNPAIVLADASVEATAKEIVSGALTFNGQRCTALKQVLVDRKIEGALVDALAAEISRLRVGMPWEDGVTITPLPDPNHPAWLDGLVDEAVERGARVVCGGAHAATLYEPALVAGVPPSSRLFVEEQFGPVVP
jgi:glyceraldehyde-3-phosphate dehydrogenase (NADP+)